MEHTTKTPANFLERTIEFISPRWAAERTAQRMRKDILTRGYDGGSRANRQFEGWRTGLDTSANTELYGTLPWLRARSRDLVRNNEYAKKAVQVLKTNCIGNGIRPSIPKNLISKTEEKKLTASWRNWAESRDCDFHGRQNYYQMQLQAWGAVIESGEVFIRKYIRTGAQIPLKLQILEAEFCDTQKDGMPGQQDGNYIVQGVEFNQAGNRVAYWLFEKHPNDMLPINGQLLSVRVPAKDVVHVYEQLRPGQVRGIPQGVAAITRLKNLADYEDAQLIRQKIAACFSVFIQKNEITFQDQYATQMGREPYDQLSEKMMPGIIDYLNPGEQVTFANPPGADGYDTFVKQSIRAVAMSYGVTYESISGDLSGVNFSSGRMGWLEMHRQIGQWQELLIIPDLCGEIWNAWIDLAVIAGIAGAIKRPRAGWTVPRREMLDPVKETKGLSDQVRAGFKSKSEVIRELGDEADDVYEEIKNERNQAKADGLMFESDSEYDATMTNFGFDNAMKLKAVSKPAAKAGA